MTLEEFLRPPSLREWEAALAAGWPGPDGSSWSTDTICGVRIGLTSPDWRYSVLPANRHDWRYYLGRTHGLPEGFRAAADAEYRDGCLARVRPALKGSRLVLATLRCHVRHAALRLGARFAWTQGARTRNENWRAQGAV